ELTREQIKVDAVECVHLDLTHPVDLGEPAGVEDRLGGHAQRLGARTGLGHRCFTTHSSGSPSRRRPGVILTGTAVPPAARTPCPRPPAAGRATPRRAATATTGSPSAAPHA